MLRDATDRLLTPLKNGADAVGLTVVLALMVVWFLGHNLTVLKLARWPGSAHNPDND